MSEMRAELAPAFPSEKEEDEVNNPPALAVRQQPVPLSFLQHIDDAGQHYDIYVRTWSSIFDDFEIRHKFLLDKLEMKRKALTAQYKNKEDLHRIVEGAKETQDN